MLRHPSIQSATLNEETDGDRVRACDDRSVSGSFVYHEPVCIWVVRSPRDGLGAARVEAERRRLGVLGVRRLRADPRRLEHGRRRRPELGTAGQVRVCGRRDDFPQVFSDPGVLNRTDAR